MRRFALTLGLCPLFALGCGGDDTPERTVTVPANGTFGNVLRNRLRGPDWQNFDMTVQRRIRLGGRAAATLRWDIFNVFDRVNFGIPNRNISDSATFGTVSTLSGDP